ncbi:MAG: alpha/beta hydrolase [Gammaproteobacteria bacterium]|nr:alpha/beta hydrolase [Gammaproteobacteria bacterium]
MKSYTVLTAILLWSFAALSQASECAILLHGLARTADSMSQLEQRLEQQGYKLVNVDYPSTTMPIAELADIAVGAGIAQCQADHTSAINFVTHSLGGILVRQYYSVHKPQSLHRVVMLGPPNNGSQVVDRFKHMPAYKWLNGPAGMQLGTDSNSVPSNLGPVNFDLGVIAGTQSINPILSSFLPNPDDGKVSVASTKVEGMCGFVALPVTHPLMMRNKTVIDEVVSFLTSGQFTSPQASNYCHQ